jgi:hypothetical protein
MEDWTLSTPVVMFIYNRPETTRAVFEQVTAVRPSDLFVVADGPRDDADEERCGAARDVIDPDWDVTLYTDFADSNLGLRERFSTGLDWVFDRVDRAIILEDDCIPNSHFFRFCQEMLETYESDERVMEITGYNPLEAWKANRQQYHLSVLGGIWGWATWDRAWAKYDPAMELWGEPEIRDRVRDVVGHEGLYARKARMFDEVHSGDLDTWDYQWQFARFVNSGLSVVPSNNLVRNIGFGDDATNTASEDDARAGLSRHKISFPIQRRPDVAPDREYDRRFYEQVLRGRFEGYLPPKVYERLLRYKSVLE